MITISVLLHHLKKLNVKLIAGEKGIGENIEYISIQEFPLKSERIKENGVLLTTFASFESPEKILDHLEWLYSKEIKAVGIHSLIMKTIPRDIIDFADAMGFSLFLIPEEISYQQITQVYYNLLVDNMNEKRMELEEVNMRMLEAVALDKGPEHILSIMGSFLNAPLIHLDKRLHIHSYWTNNVLNRQEIETITQKVVSEEKITISKESQVQYVTISDSSNTIPFQIIPLVDNISFYGVLITGHNHKTIPNESVINYGRTALLLNSIKNNAIEKYSKNNDMKNIESVLVSQMEVATDFLPLSLHVKSLKQIYIIDFNDAWGLRNFFDYIHSEISKWNSESLIWLFNEQILCITKENIPADLLQRFASLFEEISIGISDDKGAINAQTLIEKYQQAKYAASTGKDKKTKINHWNKFGFDKFLYAFDHSEMLKKDTINLLDPLLEYDVKNDAELLKTLFVYLRNFFSLKKSAEELYIHKNTVKYRMDQVKELYQDINFENPDTYLLFSTSLRLYHSLFKN